MPPSLSTGVSWKRHPWPPPQLHQANPVEHDYAGELARNVGVSLATSATGALVVGLLFHLPPVWPIFAIYTVAGMTVPPLLSKVLNGR